MQFDFTLAANQSQHIDVVGTFLKYKAGTGTIRVRLNGGGYIDLLPGQGVNNVNFTSVDVQDRTGAANVGTILAGIYDFRDDRITGSVEVISGERARTLADKAYVGYGNGTANAGCKLHVQLFNPAGSGKNLIVEQILFSSSVAQPVRVNSLFGALAGATQWTPLSKRLGGAASTVGTVWVKADQAVELGASIYNTYVQANVSQVIKVTEPFVVPPGFGLLGVASATATDLPVNFEYYEDQI